MIIQNKTSLWLALLLTLCGIAYLIFSSAPDEKSEHEEFRKVFLDKDNKLRAAIDALRTDSLIENPKELLKKRYSWFQRFSDKEGFSCLEYSGPQKPIPALFSYR